MPQRLFDNFMDMPRHTRYLIISALASLVLLWGGLTFVVGGISQYVESLIPTLHDALYLPYNIQERPLPVIPEGEYDAEFVVLPEIIAEHYVLQIPPSEEKIEAAELAQREAFLAAAVPVELALEPLVEPLKETVAANIEAAEAAAQAAAENAAAVAPTAVVAGEAVPTAAPAVEALPTLAPTTDPLQTRLAAIEIALAEIAAVNTSVAEDETLELVFQKLPLLQQASAGLTSAGVALPELAALDAKLAELAAIELPPVYKVSDCLVSSRAVTRRDEAFVIPCAIDTTATFVERGTYQFGEQALHVTAVEYPNHEAATQAVRSVFQYARTQGPTGNFSYDTIEYDYFFSMIEAVRSFTWSHENWVFSIASDDTFEATEQLMEVFPY